MQVTSRRHALWFEVATLTGLVTLPHLLVPYLRDPVWGGLHPTQPWTNVSAGLTNLGWSLPIAYILWASGDRWTSFGFRGWRTRVDVPLVLLLTVLAVLSHRGPVGSEAAVEAFRQSNMPKGPWVAMSVLFAVTIGAIFEEVFFRGYLVSRLEELTGQGWIGVAASGLLFGYCQLYLGVVSAAVAMAMGVVGGIVFLKRRSVWPLIVAHVLYGLAAAYWV